MSDLPFHLCERNVRVCVGGKSPPCNCCTAAETLVYRGAGSCYKTYSSELGSDLEFLEQTAVQPAKRVVFLTFFFIMRCVNSQAECALFCLKCNTNRANLLIYSKKPCNLKPQYND